MGGLERRAGRTAAAERSAAEADDPQGAVGEIGEGPQFGAPMPIGAIRFDATGFDSGHPSLDEWIRIVAGRAEGRTARTYVVVAADGLLAGYYCLATGSVARTDAPRKLRKDAPDPLPVAIIGRLAVSQRFARRGVGGGMLQDAFRRIIQINETVGFVSIVAHAIDTEASGFYRRFGFEGFPDGTRTMFLALSTLRSAIV